MENKQGGSKWLRSAYLVYGLTFISIVGGLIELVLISDYLNHTIVGFLEANPAGPNLSGKFLFPRNWFALFIVFICLMFLFPITSLMRYFTQEYSEIRSKQKLADEIIMLRQVINDVMRNAGNILSYTEIGCFDTKSIDIKHDISENGDTSVEALLTIECTADVANFYRLWVDADPESEAVDFFRGLRFEAVDLTAGRRLDWIPVTSGPKNKMFAIFLPDVAPGKQIKLRIRYAWPGFMRKLIELGATNFTWRYISKSADSRAPIRMEWNFSNKLAKFKCRIARRPSTTASVYSEDRVLSTAWIYHDPSAAMNPSTVYSVEFEKID